MHVTSLSTCPGDQAREGSNQVKVGDGESVCGNDVRARCDQAKASSDQVRAYGDQGRTISKNALAVTPAPAPSSHWKSLDQTAPEGQLQTDRQQLPLLK